MYKLCTKNCKITIKIPIQNMYLPSFNKMFSGFKSACMTFCLCKNPKTVSNFTVRLRI